MLNALKSTVLGNVAVVVDTYSVWSGTKKMDAMDFINIDPQDLPPEQSVTLGSKRLIDPEELKPFLQLRSRSDRTCAKYGVRTALGWVVPNDSVKALTSELVAIGNEFQKMLDDWLPEYERKVDCWIDEIAQSQPDFARVLHAARIPASTVRARFGHSLIVAQINPSAEDPADTTSTFAQGLRGSVLVAVAAEIQEYAEKLRTCPNAMFKATVRGSIQRIAERLRRFAFCDDSGLLQPFADILEQSVQGQGKIEGQEYANLRALLGTIVCPQSLELRMRALVGHSQPVPSPVAPQLPLAAAPVAPAAQPVVSAGPSIHVPEASPGGALLPVNGAGSPVSVSPPEERLLDALPVVAEQIEDALVAHDPELPAGSDGLAGERSDHADVSDIAASVPIPAYLPGTDLRQAPTELPAAAFAAPPQQPQRLIPGRVDLSW